MKNKHIKKSVDVVACFFVFITIWFISGVSAGEFPPLPHEAIGVLELKTIKEPSGICYHTIRKSFFLVDDSGVVCEFDSHGNMIQEKTIRPADFEGITHDPSTGFLYIVIEGTGSILEVDPETLECKRTYIIPRAFQGKILMKEGGQGIEAITFAPDKNHPQGGTFFVANQSFNLKNPEDISAIFELELPLKSQNAESDKVRILRYFQPDVIDLSGLYFDVPKKILYAISDFPNRIMAFTPMGNPLGIWALPGDNQEGITVDPDGIMFIAQDSGGVLKLKIDWKNMTTHR